jgi:ribosomal protein S18 acetylase RimI-like enzyme
MQRCEIEIARAGAAEVAELRELWLALHRHHRAVATYRPLLADEERSWQLRRQRYEAALVAGEAILGIATAAGGPVGYALALVHQGADDTFAYADPASAELFSLSVAPEARGQGIGGRLCEAVEVELARAGVGELEVAVMEGNDDALRFYGARGYTPSERLLRRRIEPR